MIIRYAAMAAALVLVGLMFFQALLALGLPFLGRSA